MNIFYKIQLMTCFLSALNLNAEVQEVTIKWNAFTCMDACIKGVEDNLKSIKHVTNIQINSRSGVAVMAWDPNYPFSFDPFRYAMANAGIGHIDETRVRVRGTIAHDSDNFYLVSIGDSARFLIVGPIKVEPGRYVPKNLESHAFDGDTKNQLIDAEDKGLAVTVSGPLYLPTQYPRTLIAEQIKIHAKDSQMDPRFER